MFIAWRGYKLPRSLVLVHYVVGEISLWHMSHKPICGQSDERVFRRSFCPGRIGLSWPIDNCHPTHASCHANRYDSPAMSSANPIRHVSDTALWVAVYRAQESERADAVFHDPMRVSSPGIAACKSPPPCPLPSGIPG